MAHDRIRNLEPYKRTPTFTEATVPAGLLNDHSTKDGVWGLIRVEVGELLYLVTDPRREPTEITIRQDSEEGMIEPTILHRVELLGSVRFHVEFLREPRDDETQSTSSEQAGAS